MRASSSLEIVQRCPVGRFSPARRALRSTWVRGHGCHQGLLPADPLVPSTTGFRALSPASNGRCCGVGPALSPVCLVPWPVQPRKPGQHLLGHPASPAARMRTARVGGATDRGERAGASQDRGCKRRGNVAAALSAARAGVAAGDPFAWSIPKPDRRPRSSVGALIQCGHQMITQKSSRKDQRITCLHAATAVPLFPELHAVTGGRTVNKQWITAPKLRITARVLWIPCG